MKTILLNFILIAGLASRARAGTTMLSFDGHCTGDSYTKTGDPTLDFASIKPVPVTCDFASLTMLPNGRRIVHFVDRDNNDSFSPLGFAGGQIDRSTNAKMAILPIDHIYLRQRPPFNNSKPPKDGEGFCFFDKKNLIASKQISCVTKVENDEVKTVTKIMFTVTHFHEKEF